MAFCWASKKPSSSVPFIMPKRIADTPNNVQISDATGSGPFVFRKDLWRPGERTIYDVDFRPLPGFEVRS